VVEQLFRKQQVVSSILTIGSSRYGWLTGTPIHVANTAAE